MAIVGYEVLIIAAIIIILLLWGPQKLPQMARSIGQAKREFEKTAKEVTEAAKIPTGTGENVPQDPLIIAAKSLGITTEGKTKEELVKEIAAKS